MIVMDPMPLSPPSCIFLIVLSGVYVFALVVELISHFAGGTLHIIPMPIFSLLGLIFFGVAGILLIVNVYAPIMIQIIAITLCLLAALLFLIDITIVLVFWKRKCSACKCYNGTEILPHKDKEPSASEIKTTKHDITTSLSDVRVPRELEGVVTPDHGFRKVEYPRRREYVDSPTCVPSICHLGVAQIQTESKKVSIVESQTPSAITKETPMQTLSKCEFCQQQIPFVRPVTEKSDVRRTQCFQCTSQWGYPAIVQFVRGEDGVPCCSGCKCITDTAQSSSQQLLQQRTESLTPRVKPSSNKTMGSEATQQVAIKQKEEATEIKKNAKPTNEDVERNFVKTEKPERTRETITELVNTQEKSNEDCTKENEIERSKGGGGERYTKIYEKLMRMEQGSITDLEESPTHMHMNETPPSSRMKPRALLQLKSNKVDPIKNIDVIEDQIPERIASRTMLDNQAVPKNERPARTDSPNPAIEYQLNDSCLFCRRQNLTPTSDNSRCYTVLKDKKGNYFCEFCAPSNSKKIMKRLESTDLRELRCANCRSHLRYRLRTNVKLKTDTCPRCNRSQRHAASPSST
ncbi:uncharacterized protein LOC113004200 [Solenopsis invicta]|uniref:uncharacterized protein LOC113004200 n=1 Tax=Solenopsis invicta TaxID=13686 RepID=UPI00193E9F23|nr:uncharacterized protein LOC113004200 [Solenopsis invicta]